MADYTNTLRGPGLAKFQKALQRLESNPLRLGLARRRFSNSPPLYISDSSGTTTWFMMVDPRTEEERRRVQRLMQLGMEADASRPRHQFYDQKVEEMERVWYSDPIIGGLGELPFESPLAKNATETIKKRWIEQGIWNNKWDDMADGQWKHEEPLELESKSEMDTDAESSPRPLGIFDIPKKQPRPKPRRPKRNDKKARFTEQRVVLEREREASRPYYQFVFQISKERERIQEESVNEEGANAVTVNTRAYENVKNTWIERGIWNRKWGILPGMSWKHEDPLEYKITDDHTALPEDHPVNGNYEVGEAPIITMHDAERFHSVSSSPPSSLSKWSLRNTTRHALEPAIACLSPAQSSRVPKASREKTLGHQQLPNVSRKVSSSSPQIQPSISSVVKDSRRITRSKTRQNIIDNVTTRSPAKPQGILKRQNEKNTQGRRKARKG